MLFSKRCRRLQGEWPEPIERALTTLGSFDAYRNAFLTYLLDKQLLAHDVLTRQLAAQSTARTLLASQDPAKGREDSEQIKSTISRMTVLVAESKDSVKVHGALLLLEHVVYGVQNERARLGVSSLSQLQLN